MRILSFLGSDIAKLDSNVYTGGGTDDTAAIQKILDLANDDTGVHLIMDGAALVSSLKVSSNTTIECMSKACGFFQLPQTNAAIISNKNWSMTERNTRNVEIKGGTYNQDCRNQLHHMDATPEESKFYLSTWRPVFALEFYGVENFLMRDVTVVDFRTYAFMMVNFKNCTIEDTWLELPHHMGGNQDGFHFWGPGQFLTLRNVGGRVGDDFMNIGPDEGDGKSSITDVIVDGVFLDEADQAIRLLSRGEGLLDRVTIRNVHGTYKSFGFYIDPWYRGGTAGNFGDLFIENVNLEPMKPNYFYHQPILFSVGGDIRCLTLKNIRNEYPIDNRPMFELGVAVPEIKPEENENYVKEDGKKPVIQNLIAQGITVIENEKSENHNVFEVYGAVGNMIVKDVLAVKDPGVAPSGNLVKMFPGGEIDTLVIKDDFLKGMNRVRGEEKIKNLITE